LAREEVQRDVTEREAPQLSAVDLLAVDERFGAEQREVQRTVRSWARKRLLADIEAWFEEGDFPTDLAPELGALGLFGMYAEPDGTPGMDPVSYGLVMLELEAIDSGFRSFCSVQSALSMFPIQRYGSDEQKARWLPPLASGEAIGCFGLSEPDAGSDPASMRTHARKEGSGWVVSGSKMWITNGSRADVAIVWAQTDGGIRGFLVEKDSPGFTSRDVHRKLSLRASVTSELTLDAVRVPDDAMLPGVQGLRGPLSCLNEARYGIAWGVMGAARTCLEVARDYATSREQFGRPIGSFQLTQAKLADMSLEYTKGLLLAERIAQLKAEGTLRPEQVSVAKLNNTRVALEIARQCRTILGANGITLEYPVIRHAANLESVLTYEGTAEVHQLAIGRALTGLNAFS
jgi:glutaryl-CoA dehydrogenase